MSNLPDFDRWAALLRLPPVRIYAGGNSEPRDQTFEIWQKLFFDTPTSGSTGNFSWMYGVIMTVDGKFYVTTFYDEIETLQVVVDRSEINNSILFHSTSEEFAMLVRLSAEAIIND